MRVLVTRPEPGASRTAARLSALGHEAVVVPLFAARRLAWEMPEAFGAVAFTSANGVRFGAGSDFGSSSFQRKRELRITERGAEQVFSVPSAAALGSRLRGNDGGGSENDEEGGNNHAVLCYCVGPETAAAARAAGFSDIRTGPTDVATLFQTAANDGIQCLVHLTGRDRTDVTIPPGLTVIVREVYAMDPLADAQIPDADLALLYSARAASRLTELVGPARAHLAVGVLSPAIATALGPGWRAIFVAAAPNEDALFAACGLTCEKPS